MEENKIICFVQPFLGDQKIMVFVKGAATYQDMAPLDEMHTHIMRLADVFYAKDVEIVGNPIFANRVKSNIENQTNYTHGKLNIKVTGR